MRQFSTWVEGDIFYSTGSRQKSYCLLENSSGPKNIRRYEKERRYVVFIERHQIRNHLGQQGSSPYRWPLVRLSPWHLFCIILWRRHVSSTRPVQPYHFHADLIRQGADRSFIEDSLHGKNILVSKLPLADKSLLERVYSTSSGISIHKTIIILKLSIL